METQRTHDEMVEILDRNTLWIENCDNKTSIILGVIGVVGGIFLANDYVEKLYSIILFMISKEHLGAYAGLVVQAFRRSWCIDSGLVVHAFR